MTEPACTDRTESVTSNTSSPRSNGRISSDLRPAAIFLPGLGTGLKGCEGPWDVFMEQPELFLSFQFLDRKMDRSSVFPQMNFYT